MADLSNKSDRLPEEIGTTETFDLKFSPVIGLDNLRSFAKFQFGHLHGLYFTDRSLFYL